MNATIFTHLLLVFLIAFFDIRRYDGAYLISAYVHVQ